MFYQQVFNASSSSSGGQFPQNSSFWVSDWQNLLLVLAAFIGVAAFFSRRSTVRIVPQVTPPVEVSHAEDIELGDRKTMAP